MLDTPNLPENDQERDFAIREDANQEQAANATSFGAEHVNEDRFYDIEEDEEPTDESAPFATPFQRSGPMLAVASQAHATPSPSDAAPVRASSPTPVRRFPMRRVVLLSTGIVVLLAVLATAVFAQAIPSLMGGKTLTAPATATIGRPHANTPTAKAHASSTPTMRTVQGSPSPDWVPQTLPAGWAAAGLSVADALDAERTAWTFTDREMSLDFRSAGTRATHASTFTAATFLLTPAARVRFAQNDLRAAGNVLFDAVQQRQVIQEVVNAQPRLVKFQSQGQQQFAWVEVSFQLWQSQLDPQHPGQRIEGREVDPITKQPIVHHMAVLLLRVQPGTQGINPPMGGTGWLVSTYALDPGDALPTIVLPA